MPRPLFIVALIVSLFANAPFASAEDVRDKLRDVYDQMAKKARDARKEYSSDLARAARGAISQYERLAAEAVRKGDLTAATEAWRQVLALDREHTKAVAYFNSIGRLEAELEKLAGRTSLQELEDAATASPNAGVREFEGSAWQYGSQGNMILLPNGATQLTSPTDREKRVWSVDSQGRLMITIGDGSKILIAEIDEKASIYKGIIYVKQGDMQGRRVR